MDGKMTHKDDRVTLYLGGVGAWKPQGPILEAPGGPNGDLNVGGWGSGPKYFKNI